MQQPATAWLQHMHGTLYAINKIDMNKFYKILMIWGGVILGGFLLYLLSPMDGSATRQDGKVFALLTVGAIIGTILVLRGKSIDE